MKTWLVAILFGVAAHAAAQAPATAPASDIQTRHKVINQALAAATQVKAQIAQYYLHNKAFPSSNAELGMNLPAAYRTYDLKSIAVGAGGVIELTLTASSGVDNGVIRLTPEAALKTDENGLAWTCASADYSTISDATGGVCEYTNQP
jgi:hypothetical protein